ncbi:UNVERIFIED_CONTAM: hypothetical protein GTU68_056143 [Idotea baltica]|nr:hypothetical protein [Idotea baltica]
MSVNKVLLLGHLGADPELRYTNNQTAVCNLRVATNDRRKGADGQWTDFTEWHKVSTFGKTAENCNTYIKKGSQVFVEGRIQTRKWQDQEGKDRYSTEIVANSVQFIGSKSKGGDYSQQQSSQSQSQPQASAGEIDMSSVGKAVSFDDDDIPF